MFVREGLIYFRERRLALSAEGLGTRRLALSAGGGRLDKQQILQDRWYKCIGKEGILL